MSDKTLRNEEILRKAKKGVTLKELSDEYGVTESNLSVLLNRMGYRKCEINNKIKENEKRK